MATIVFSVVVLDAVGTELPRREVGSGEPRPPKRFLFCVFGDMPARLTVLPSDTAHRPSRGGGTVQWAPYIVVANSPLRLFLH